MDIPTDNYKINLLQYLQSNGYKAATTLLLVAR